MYKNINFQDFCDAFAKMNRDNNFSYEGKQALFDYLEEYEESTGEKIELDIIALCCEYTEYKNLEELQQNYDKIRTMRELEDNTQVIPFGEESFIIQNY
jgi:hypothetical protein